MPDWSFLLEHNRIAFARRWSPELAGREPPEPTSPIAIERAVLRGMGRPATVLVIEDRAPGPALESQVAVITEATRTMFGVGRCHVSVFPTMELIGDLVAACELGVEIVDEPLEEHAIRLDGSYSLVVIAGSENYQQFARTARQLAPSALIVYDDGLLNRQPLRPSRFRGA